MIGYRMATAIRDWSGLNWDEFYLLSQFPPPIVYEYSYTATAESRPEVCTGRNNLARPGPFSTTNFPARLVTYSARPGQFSI